MATGQKQFSVNFISVHISSCYTISLLKSNIPEIAAISEKSIKETRYHVKWSSEWVIRLGDGTEESHARMMDAMQNFESLDT